MIKKQSIKTILVACSSAMILSACEHSSSYDRQRTASDRAFYAHMDYVAIEANPFLLTSYYRIADPSKPLRVYIEGDGFAWRTRTQPSRDPTPKNPIALKLASLDSYDNVAYIARPCQYTKLIDTKKACNMKYWTSHRFSNEVLASMFNALSYYASTHEVTEFELVGFSGGANIASLLASRRSDITSLRTVAGNIDNDKHTRFHGVSAMPSSLNAADYAFKLADIPQIHFIGTRDKIVPDDIAKSYFAKLDHGKCFTTKYVDASHTEGWASQWAGLVGLQPNCQSN